MYIHTILFASAATLTPSSTFSFQAMKFVQPACSQDLLWVAGHPSLTSSTRPAWLRYVIHSDMHPISETLQLH